MPGTIPKNVLTYLPIILKFNLFRKLPVDLNCVFLFLDVFSATTYKCNATKFDGTGQYNATIEYSASKQCNDNVTTTKYELDAIKYIFVTTNECTCFSSFIVLNCMCFLYVLTPVLLFYLHLTTNHKPADVSSEVSETSPGE